LVLGNGESTVDITVRFLQVVQRTVEDLSSGVALPVEELRVDNFVYRPWEESMEQELRLGGGHLTLSDLGCAQVFDVQIASGRSQEQLAGEDGAVRGRLMYSWSRIDGKVEVSAEPVGQGCFRLTVRIANVTSMDPDQVSVRCEAVKQTMVSTHTIMFVCGGEFVSMLETPDHLKAAAESCSNIKTWPVLAGVKGSHHAMLSSPIILYDYPQVSPESPQDLFETTEIDELLTLSIMTLTDEERREMRESDPRGRAILERTDSMSQEELMKLHGSIRNLQALRRDSP
jgi:hydrogenase maturation protease